MPATEPACASWRADAAGATVGPLLKWPGGKRRELPLILETVPRDIDRYVEPFVGGGAVLFAMPPSVPALVNDSSSDLMGLYRSVARRDPDLFALLEAIDGWWEALGDVVAQRGRALVEAFLALRAPPSSARDDATSAAAAAIARHREALAATVPSALQPWREDFLAEVAASVPRKLARMRRVELDRSTELPDADVWANLEGAVKAGCYTSLRRAYNASRRAGDTGGERAALFLFLREYAYAAMFRFNGAGDFNVPYGGVSYNRKRLARKVAHLRSPQVTARLDHTRLACDDFGAFLAEHEPGPGDFVFLDPPYDSDFRDYDARGFGPADHERLAAWLDQLTCAFLLVIKATPLTERLFVRPDRWVRATDKTYSWTIKDRNDRRAVHLLISNYDQGSPPTTPESADG